MRGPFETAAGRGGVPAPFFLENAKKLGKKTKVLVNYDDITINSAGLTTFDSFGTIMPASASQRLGGAIKEKPYGNQY
jgi:hypothetical protein